MSMIETTRNLFDEAPAGEGQVHAVVMSPVVVSLCDRTGNMVKPWAEAGYECWCVDIQHSIRRDGREGNINFVWGDANTWLPPQEIRGRIAILFAFPPCTNTSLSGARDFQKKGSAMLRHAVELFENCEKAGAWAGVPYMVENPASVISTHYRKPDYKFQPWQYGDLWQKETWLWTGNEFRMPRPIHAMKPEGVTQKIWQMPPSDDRADLRAETPPGFARAVFEANAGNVQLGFRAA